MAVVPVTSNYNVRRRKQSLGPTVVQPLEESPRLSKRQRSEKREVFTPPASPDVIETVSAAGDVEYYDDDQEDAVLMGILDYMRRVGGSAMCSREISEGLLQEGKVPLVGATPSTLVDSSIKQHHKRCSSNSRNNIIQKVADPRFPRKTLYHLANADPFAPRKEIVTPVLVKTKSESKPARTVTIRKKEEQAVVESDSSDSDSGPANELEALVNDCQGPFAASFDTRRRMSLSPSEDDLDFSLSIDDVCPPVPTPAPSLPVSPSKELLQKTLKFPALNIALPPSPFIAPRDRTEDDDDDTEHDHALKIPDYAHSFTNSPFTRKRDLDDDFHDVEVQSPEAVSLDDLEYLLGY